MARRKLTESGVQADHRDFFAQPLNEVELEDLAAGAGGLKTLASTASPAFRARGLPLDDWSDDALRAAMLRDPHLLKRPILQRDSGKLLIGLPAIMRELAA